jgi:hypothetical protein
MPPKPIEFRVFSTFLQEAGSGLATRHQIKQE